MLLMDATMLSIDGVTRSCMEDFQFIMYMLGPMQVSFDIVKAQYVFTHESRVIANILRIVIMIIL